MTSIIISRSFTRDETANKLYDNMQLQFTNNGYIVDVKSNPISQGEIRRLIKDYDVFIYLLSKEFMQNNEWIIEFRNVASLLLSDEGKLLIPLFTDNDVTRRFFVENKINEYVPIEHDANSYQKDIDWMINRIETFIKKNSTIDLIYTHKIEKSKKINIMKKIFISHSNKDNAIITPLVDLIMNIGISPNEIFYSSHPAFGPRIGENIFDALKSVLSNDVLALFILSKNFYNSPICLCEMGAVWIKANKQIPILIPPFGFSDIQGVFPNTLGFNINDQGQLENLKLLLEDSFLLNPIHPVLWGEKRDEYLKKIKELIFPLSPPPVPSSPPPIPPLHNLIQVEIESDPDFKWLINTIKARKYTKMSFERIKDNLSAKFTKEFVEDLVHKHSTLIMKVKFKDMRWGIKFTHKLENFLKDQN